MPKRILQGVVVSDKNDKTVVVRVERRFTHPVLKKTVRRPRSTTPTTRTTSTRSATGLDRGDRPISKIKRWEWCAARRSRHR